MEDKKIGRKDEGEKQESVCVFGLHHMITETMKQNIDFILWRVRQRYNRVEEVRYIEKYRYIYIEEIKRKEPNKGRRRSKNEGEIETHSLRKSKYYIDQGQRERDEYNVVEILIPKGYEGYVWE